MTTYTATLNGYTFGCDQDWDWYEAPPSGIGPGDYRGDRVATFGRDGEWPTGSDRASSGRLVFELEYRSEGDRVGVELAAQALRAAFAPFDGSGLVELTVEMASGTYVVRGRPMAPDTPADNWQFGYGRARVVFEALDPLWYTSAFTTVFVTMPVVGTDGVVVAVGGVTVAAGGVTVAAGSTASSASLLNTGTAAVEWTATLAGPILNPRLTVGTKTVSLALDIPAGSTATVDSRTRSVTMDGAPRSAVLFGSQWAKIPPNEAVSFSLRGDSGTGTATLSFRSGSR